MKFSNNPTGRVERFLWMKSNIPMKSKTKNVAIFIVKNLYEIKRLAEPRQSDDGTYREKE